MYIHTLLVGSGVFVGLLGVAYYGKIHNITYFILVQIGVGVFEVSVGTYQFWLGCHVLLLLHTNTEQHITLFVSDGHLADFHVPWVDL